MSKHPSLVLTLPLMAAACIHDSGPVNPDPPAPEVPAAIAVPVPDQHFIGSYHAEGVQIYTCAEGATGYAWTLKAPEADLFDRDGNAAGTHYAGPSWEALDGSKVVGMKVSDTTPDATAIPWLLLAAKEHAGEGTFSDVSYIQRIDTVGGLAPSTSCDASHATETARVQYSATYLFYTP